MTSDSPRRALFAMLIALAALSAACGHKAQTEEAEHDAPAPVQVREARLGSIDHIISADAVLYPVNQANVTAKIAAPIRRVLVNRGDHVRAGQLLAELESRDIQAAASEARSQLDQAQASLQTTTGATVLDDRTKAQSDAASARQALDAAKKVYASRVELVKQGALAQKLADDAQVALVQAQSQYDTAQRHLETLQQVGQREQIRGAEAQAAAARAHYESASAQLAYAEIRSPIAGVVADRPVYPGEMPPSGGTLVSIVDISQVIARANVPVKEAGMIRVGRPAVIAGPEGTLDGKVTVVSPAVNPNTTTVEVWVQAVNPGERLKPGGTVRVSITAETIKDAVIVPAAALLNLQEGGQKIMVAAPGNVAQERKVEIGVRNGDDIQILSGIREGEKVIVAGGLGLEDKAKITPSAAAGAEEDKDEADEKDGDKKEGGK